VKYEATASCQPLQDGGGECRSTMIFDTLSACLAEVMKTFDVAPADIEVKDGKWQFVTGPLPFALQYGADPNNKYRYTVKVQRVDPVLPSELKRELEKACWAKSDKQGADD